MLTAIKKFEEKSQTIKEARVNVRQLSLAKEIIAFILISAVIFIGSMLLTGLVEGSYEYILNGGEDIISQLIGLYSFIFIIILVYLIVTKIEKRSWRSTGVSKGNAVISILKGLLIGFVMFLVVVIIGLALGQYTYNGFDLSAIVLIIPFFFGFMVQSFAEEFHDRGWTLTFITKRHGIFAAVLISSLSFSALHLLNAGVDLLSLINTFLVGILFALLFLVYDNIWVCGAAHTAWNFSQGILFGFQISGQATPSLLKCGQVSQNLIGGGKFGPESSLIATFVMVIGIIVIVWLNKNRIAS